MCVFTPYILIIRLAAFSLITIVRLANSLFTLKSIPKYDVIIVNLFNRGLQGGNINISC